MRMKKNTSPISHDRAKETCFPYKHANYPATHMLSILEVNSGRKSRVLQWRELEMMVLVLVEAGVKVEERDETMKRSWAK